MEVAPTMESYEDIDAHMSRFIRKGDKIALLLDYDGTLAPLANNPCLTVMEPETVIALKQLSRRRNVFLAVISGRGAANVKNKVGLDNITYAGNHGLEIFYENGKQFHYEVPAEFVNNFTKMVKELQEKVAKRGGWVENKFVSLTYHYCDVPEELHAEFAISATKIIQSYGYVAGLAHLAVEAKPPVHWNKGEAALLILSEKYGHDWASNVKVVFAGDDTTDEDAMKSLKGRGISFRVESLPDIHTYADFRLPSTKTVSFMLQWLADNSLDI